MDLEFQERLLHGDCLETMGFQAVLEESKEALVVGCEQTLILSLSYVFFP